MKPTRRTSPPWRGCLVVVATILAGASLGAPVKGRAATPPAPAPTAAAPAAVAAASSAGLRVVPAGEGAVELRSGGAMVARVAVTTPPLRRGTIRLREWEVDSHRVVELRIPVRGRAAEEVWIGDLTSKPVRVIWSGVAGPRDADEETAIAVEVTPERIFEYQTAAQVSRCDGEPVRLFTRAWDFGTGKFRPILATVPAPATAATHRLTARRGDPAMPATRPIGGFHFTAASTTAAAGPDARALSAPTALDDGDAKTVWSEGLGGDGRGEFLTARASAGHYRVRGLRLIPGDGSSAVTFKRRNRLRSLAVAFGADPARMFDVEFSEDPAAAEGKFAMPYWVAFPTPVDAACLTVIIRDVYRGSEPIAAGGGGTTSISDLEVFTELDDAAGVAKLVADMATGVDCASRVPLLAALGEEAIAPAAGAIVAGKATGVGRECLVEALSRIQAIERHAPALNAMAAALVGASVNEERLISETVRHAQAKQAALVPVAALATLLAPAKTKAHDSSPRADGQAAPAGTSVQTTSADRERAARLLAELDRPDAAAALLAAAGAEDSETRLAVIQALGKSPAITVPMLISAIEGARQNGGGQGGGDGEAAYRREADLIRALPAVTRRRPGDRGQAIQTTRRALETSPSFEVRARAILALGQLGGPANGNAGAEAAVNLEKVAVTGVAGGGDGKGEGSGHAAPPLLGSDVASDLAAVREHSRDAVLRFLATRELGSMGGATSLAALRVALGDSDPRVRETAAQGLGQQRDVASEAVLIEAAKSEPWPFARRAQVEALARTCGAPARDLLARAMERDVDEVRRAALVGLVRCRDPRARPTLLATLKNRRASAALRALSGALLGELGDRTITAELAETLGGLVNESEGDLAIEGVATAALRSLAQLGGGDAARAAARLAADTRHPAYRRVAVESLGQICDPDAGAKALLAARKSNDGGLAAAAEKAEQRCR